MATLADILRQTGYSQDGTLAMPTPTESPMTKVLAEHIKSIPQKFAENQANQMNLLNQAFPGNTYESMMTQGDPKALAELAMQTPFNAMVAYHGTPHNILGKFDISKVGTGEGAQAYGHGMYFAENPAVAEEYKKILSEANFVSNSGKNLKDMPSSGGFAPMMNEMKKNGKTDEEIIQTLKNISAGNHPNAKYAKSLADKLETNKLSYQQSGNLYKVDIPDEYIPNMLDWDKPLLQQTPQVQKALATLGIKTDKQKLQAFDDALLDALMNDASATLPKQPINPTGADIYQTYVKGNPQLTSQKLNEAGIRGIRYLDEGSRGNFRAQTTFKGEPYSDVISFKTKGQLDDFIKEKEAEGFGVKTFPQTSNFVVFDPSEVKILEKNSKPVSRKELIEQQVNNLK